MKKSLFFLLVMAGMVAFNSCQKDESIEIVKTDELALFEDNAGNGDVIPGQYVVVFNESSFKFSSSKAVSYAEKQNEVKQIADNYFKSVGINYELKQIYGETLKGFCAKISDEDAQKLSNDNNIKYIVPDRMYVMAKPAPQPPAESKPWGITRVGGGATYTGTHVAWIIDTGVDLDHPDLNVNASRGYDFINNDALADDDNGHGSHCAGTVAAIDNTIGVIGVAAGATIIPVKVLNRRGSGAYSIIIAGIDFVGANAAPGDAVNMSLGGGVYQPIDDAVLAASNKGIFFALAAGNETDDANNHSPARVNGTYIWTISAMDSADKFAYFSNYGNPPVDFCAPGVNIYSTYKGGGYTTMSGTSMAAPHMCGILLMTNGNPKTSGYVLSDPDGKPDPIAHI
ncbi:MAG: S8 family peptidase [Bacteroidales bacterium]|jgi:subtilisin family serine protease|nr:S8 family peptidase [Bacteroidales bacterium]